MRTKSIGVIALVLALSLLIGVPALACTSIAVTKGASADGSVMTAHTCDGWYDARTWVVPAADHKPGEMAAVYRGLLHGDRKPADKIGEIPEVAHTYKYFYAAYPYMNEHQVIMGETTIGNRRELSTTEGIMYIEQLQIFALQRARTAREAIVVMGALAEQYGYIDSGECLTVGDSNEMWIFEIMPAGPFQKGAIWAAVRIPDGHVTVSANRSRIGRVDPKDTKNYLCSSNILSFAKDNGWWDPRNGEFLFYQAYGDSTSIYCSRREWRALSWAAPSLKLDPVSNRFPLSVKAEKPISVRDMTVIYRDTYEGTPFDMGNNRVWFVPDGKGGYVKSPFATPHVGTDGRNLMNIARERNIAIPGCSYFTILQARGWLPAPIGTLCWFGLNNPDTSVYVPIYSGVTELPANYAVNDRTVFSMKNREVSAWWAFDFVDNLVNQRYQEAIKDVRPVRDAFEAEQFTVQPAVESAALELYKTNPALAVKFLTDYTASRCNSAVAMYWNLAELLIAKYDDKTF